MEDNKEKRREYMREYKRKVYSDEKGKKTIRTSNNVAYLIRNKKITLEESKKYKINQLECCKAICLFNIMKESDPENLRAFLTEQLNSI
jgi:ribonuclease BN (tRNA processing enzyme)